MNNSISLSELCSRVEAVVYDSFPDTCWVRAEIASLMVKTGNCYMDLVEKSADGLYAAKVRATCWSSLWGMLGVFFREETGSPLQQGMQVLMQVEVQYHPVYGLSLNVRDIDPSYTIGDLARQRMETIRRLQADGVWDMQRMLDIPSLPMRIAVISAPTAAGYEDFRAQLENSGFAFTIALYPALMQGEGAALSIAAALDKIAAEDNNRWDIVVIIRGGGASADLVCFDDYELCSHVAQFPLPVVAGIGHTRDMSVLDSVASMSLKTPTAVADWLIGIMNNEWARLQLLRQRLQQTAGRQILIRRHQIQLLRQRVETCSPELIYRKGYTLLMSDGKVVRSVSQVKSGDRLTTCLQDGTIVSVAE